MTRASICLSRAKRASREWVSVFVCCLAAAVFLSGSGRPGPNAESLDSGTEKEKDITIRADDAQTIVRLILDRQADLAAEWDPAFGSILERWLFLGLIERETWLTYIATSLNTVRARLEWRADSKVPTVVIWDDLHKGPEPLVPLARLGGEGEYSAGPIMASWGLSRVTIVGQSTRAEYRQELDPPKGDHVADCMWRFRDTEGIWMTRTHFGGGFNPFGGRLELKGDLEKDLPSAGEQSVRVEGVILFEVRSKGSKEASVAYPMFGFQFEVNPNGEDFPVAFEPLAVVDDPRRDLGSDGGVTCTALSSFRRAN